MWQPQSPSEPPPPQSPPGAPVDAAPARRRNPGRRFGHVIRLRPERVAEYKACHARIWPEVAKQIKDCGLEDCESGRRVSSPLRVVRRVPPPSLGRHNWEP